jgi:hypothetical protein
MRARWTLLFLVMLVVSSCGAGRYTTVPASQLPNPANYALTAEELPEVGVSWGKTYSQTSEEQGYKWTYQAYQAYQPGISATEPDYAYAVNNDVYFYETDMHNQDLPQPPKALGNIQDVSWKPGTQLHKVGEKSAVWKTALGDMLTPVWWLEFYKGHAYVRISLLGFPDQIAPAIIYGLADIIAERLPSSTDELISAAATQLPAQFLPTGGPTPSPSVSPGE